MSHLNKQKILVSLVICLLLNATEVFACVCVTNPKLTLEDLVRNGVKQSRMVFAGKAVGFEYRKGVTVKYAESRHIEYETKVFKFLVERWWKGDAPREIILATDEVRYADGGKGHSGCDYNFKEGESYLVFAYQEENALHTGICSGTGLLDTAKEVLKILGEGKEPVQKKEEPTKLMDVLAKQQLSYNLKNASFWNTQNTR